ncbi:MAG: EpsG family protein [bacterium]
MLGLMFILLSTIIFGIIIPKANGNNRKVYLFITFSIMFFYSALRGSSVGIDTSNYLDIFNEIKYMGLVNSVKTLRFEYGFIFFNYLLSFTNNAQLFLIATSLFIFYSFSKTIYRYSYNVIISTFLFVAFFFGRTMNTVRQFVALSIILLSLPYLFNKKTLKFVIMVIMASMFHSTAILFMVLTLYALPKININNYTLLKMNINKKTIMATGIIVVVLIYKFDLVVNFFFALFPQYSRFMNVTRYTATSEVNMFWVIFYGMFAILAVIYMNKKESGRPNFDISNFSKRNYAKKPLGFFVILLVLQIGVMYFSSKMYIANRLEIYTNISICFVFPAVLEEIFSTKIFRKYPIVKYIIYFIFVLAFSVFAYSMFSQNPYRILPYNFYWNNN